MKADFSETGDNSLFTGQLEKKELYKMHKKSDFGVLHNTSFFFGALVDTL